MQYTHNDKVNRFIDQIHQRILFLFPEVIIHEQPGFRATNYGLASGMKAVKCYIICYDQKANLGFPNGIAMVNNFPQLKGTGKTHRHVEINEQLLANPQALDRLIKQAFQY